MMMERESHTRMDQIRAAFESGQFRECIDLCAASLGLNFDDVLIKLKSDSLQFDDDFGSTEASIELISYLSGSLTYACLAGSACPHPIASHLLDPNTQASLFLGEHYKFINSSTGSVSDDSAEQINHNSFLSRDTGILLAAQLIRHVKQHTALSARWTVRICRILQHQLERKSLHLYTMFLSAAKFLFPLCDDELDEVVDAPAVTLTMDDVLMYIELAFGFLEFFRMERAMLCLRKTGIQVEFQGVKGRRMVHQQEDQSQLIANVFFEKGCNFEDGTELNKCTCDQVLKNASFDEFFEVLDDIELTDGGDDSVVGFADPQVWPSANARAVVSIWCVAKVILLQRTQALSAIVRERMRALLDFVLRTNQQHNDLPNSVAVVVFGLRCELESTEDMQMSYRERSLRQYDEVVKFIAEYSYRQCLRCTNHNLIFSLPSQHWVESNVWRQNAKILQLFEMIHAALLTLKRIGDVEGSSALLLKLGRNEEARSLIEQLIEVCDEPSTLGNLLCMLAATRGDDDETLLKAWESSNHRCAEAMRRLGKKYRMLNDHEKSIECYSNAVRVNAFAFDAWFSIGFSQLQMNRPDEAAKSFARVVALDKDYGNAWNNLAAAHMHAKNSEGALNALLHAVKFKADDWHVWENLCLCAVDLKRWQRAITSYERLVNLKNRVMRHHDAKFPLDDGGIQEDDSRSLRSLNISLLETIVNAVISSEDIILISTCRQVLMKLTNGDLAQELVAIPFTECEIHKLCLKFFNKAAQPHIMCDFLKKFSACFKRDVSTVRDFNQNLWHAAADTVSHFAGLAWNHAVAKQDETTMKSLKSAIYSFKLLLKGVIRKHNAKEEFQEDLDRIMNCCTAEDRSADGDDTSALQTNNVPSYLDDWRS